MFENLTARLARTVDGLRGRGRITEDNVGETLREVRMALLEADVALPVIKTFIEAVKAKALGAEVAQSLTPGQVFVSIIHHELVELMGGAREGFNLRAQPPIVVLLAVLNRHAGVSLQEHDVFANVVGGLDIDEPAWDLPVAIALASSLRDVLLPASLIVFGEVGLTGEVRPVTFGEERIREAAKQGFTTAIVPRDNLPRVAVPGIAVQPVARIDEALRAALVNARGPDRTL